MRLRQYGPEFTRVVPFERNLRPVHIDKKSQAVLPSLDTGGEEPLLAVNINRNFDCLFHWSKLQETSAVPPIMRKINEPSHNSSHLRGSLRADRFRVGGSGNCILPCMRNRGYRLY